jgi:hypothetical protein
MDAFAEPGERRSQNDMTGCLKERCNLSPLPAAGQPAVSPVRTSSSAGILPLGWGTSVKQSSPETGRAACARTEGVPTAF